ncbi:MAG: hypothetical protein RLY77_837, partial [Pseudomonadota bacterium]
MHTVGRWRTIVANLAAQYRSNGSTSSDQRTRRASGAAYKAAIAVLNAACNSRLCGDDT